MYIEEECECYCRYIRNENVESMCILINNKFEINIDQLGKTSRRCC